MVIIQGTLNSDNLIHLYRLFLQRKSSDGSRFTSPPPSMDLEFEDS